MYDNGYGSTSTRRKMSCESFSVERGQGKKETVEKTLHINIDFLSTQTSQPQTSGAEPLDESQRGRAWRPPGDSLRTQGLSELSVSTSRLQHQSCWPGGQREEDSGQAGGEAGSDPGAFQLSQEEIRQTRLGGLGRVMLCRVSLVLVHVSCITVYH